MESPLELDADNGSMKKQAPPCVEERGRHRQVGDGELIGRERNPFEPHQLVAAPDRQTLVELEYAEQSKRTKKGGVVVPGTDPIGRYRRDKWRECRSVGALVGPVVENPRACDRVDMECAPTIDDLRVGPDLQSMHMVVRIDFEHA